MKDLVQNQKAHFNSGVTLHLSYRKEMLLKFKEVFKQNEQLFLDAIKADFSKGAFDTYTTEFAMVFHEIDQALKYMKKWASPKKVRTNVPNKPAKSFIYPEPYGTVLVIGAWNYPYQLSLVPAISALAAGNTVIIKPSELAANTSQAMAKAFNDAFNPQVLYVQEGGVVETTQLLEQQFDKIFFTGSSPVGKIIYQAAAKNMTPVTLELGGKSPAFVLPDANIDVSARRLVWGKFLNAGQTCVAPDYIMVHADVKEKLLAKMKQYILEFYGENPIESQSYVRIINEKNFNRLVDLIDKKKVYHGSELNKKELFIGPTLLHNVGFDDKIMREEIFGPVFPVIDFTDLAAAVKEVKALEKPLALYIFSKSDRHIDYILSSISFGGGCINDTVMHLANSYLPFGGVGNSGMGNYHCKYGFDCFTHQKSILKKGYNFEALIKYPPYTFDKLKWVKRIMSI
jgi:aldehyde dehydrogenase (NAD+)